MIQNIEDRIARAEQYMQESSFARGVARSLRDVATHIKDFAPGSDPARKAIEIALEDIIFKATETIAYAEKLEMRAASLRRMVGASND